MSARDPLGLDGLRWWPGAGVTREMLDRVVAAAATDVPRTILKRERRKVAYRMQATGREWLVKVEDHHARPFWRRLGRSTARHDLACAAHLARHGLATPPPLAAGEARRVGLDRSVEILPWIDGAVDLAALLRDASLAPRERRGIATGLGRFVAALHAAGLDQDDLAPNNFLWRRDGTPALLAVDFERARVRRRVSSAARVAALAKLLRHAQGASRSERLRFVQAYVGGDADAGRAWWRSIERAAVGLLVHDVRRWRRTATRSGRRFAAVRRGAFAGWIRRDTSLDALASAWGDPDAQWVVRPLSARTDRAATDALAVALALAQRGLAPAPVALLASEARWHLVFERPSAVRCTAAPGSAAPALSVLIGRLLALGAVSGALTYDSFLFAAGARGAWLVDVECFSVGQPPTDRRAAMRALSARLGGGSGV